MLTRRRFASLGSVAVGASIGAPWVARAQNLDLVRFCWGGSVIVSGQVQHTLKNTDIAARHGLKIEMIQFTAGPGISEALISGAGDVGSLSDFSGVTMMAAGAPLTAIAHESSFRSALLATPKSGIKTVADLKGKSVYGLFGVTAYQNAQRAVSAAGLTPGRDVKFVNLGVAELADAVRSQKIDAFFTWDPWISMFEQAGFGQTLASSNDPSMILMAPSKLISQKPDVLKRFLRAHSEAVFYASQNHAQANQWYRSVDPGRNVPELVVEKASAFDPQWNAKKPSDIKRVITPAAIESMNRMAQWGFGEKLLPRAVDVRQFVNTAIAQAADDETARTPFDLSSVKVLR